MLLDVATRSFTPKTRKKGTLASRLCVFRPLPFNCVPGGQSYLKHLLYRFQYNRLSFYTVYFETICAPLYRSRHVFKTPSNLRFDRDSSLSHTPTQIAWSLDCSAGSLRSAIAARTLQDEPVELSKH